MNRRIGHTVGTNTVIREERITAWTFDDIINAVPQGIIRRVQACDAWAKEKLEAEARTHRDGVPGGMICADVLDEYFREWHAMEAISGEELNDLLNGTVG